MINLQKLDCSYIQISDLSPLSGLINLKQLHCSGTQITNLFPLSRLSKLQILDCSYTQISDLSPLARLPKLKKLDLASTQITNLSPLSRLSKLQKLDFSSTQVSDLSPLLHLSNLQHLFFAETQVTELSPLSKLNNLEKLDFSVTQVSNLSSLSDLSNLQHLSFYETEISDLSPLSGLFNLELLDCRKTLVSDLLPLLPLLKKNITVKMEMYGGGIIVKDCPLTNPPIEVVNQGHYTILRYFDEREKAGTDQIYEAKLLLIGEGGAGKTTLCNKLFDIEAELPKEQDSTQGIDIKPYYFEIPNGNKFRLNVWDFAGQGKYQSAHSFFYTHRSLYVLVDDTRTLDENEAYRTFYNYWLQTVELFGGNSPLIILHNQKADRIRTGFNLGSFQSEYPFVKELFCINLGNKDTAGIWDLKKQIERWAQKLPHIGDVVPKTWVKVREDIETERQARPYISDERYREICEAHGITDELKQSDLSRYFHDLGVFLHFQDNSQLRRDVFLQNQWVTNAVYKILDDTEIAVKKRGRFDKTDLVRLWNEGLYQKRRDELLALMLQFELCYQVQDTDIYVAPQLLPGDLPVYNLGSEIPLQLKYEYVFMPKGLLYRLIVRLHRHIAQQQSAVWNSGVVLEREDVRADVVESLNRRQISIRAMGLRAKELVTIINEEVEKLHATYGDRLKVEVKVPCNCRLCKEITTPNFYDKKDLDNRIAKRKQTVECKVSFEDVNVQGLLNGVFTTVIKNTKDIYALLASGNIETALDAMKRDYPEAMLLLGQFVSANRDRLAGISGQQEFEKIQNRIIAAALELLKH